MQSDGRVGSKWFIERRRQKRVGFDFGFGNQVNVVLGFIRREEPHDVGVPLFHHCRPMNVAQRQDLAAEMIRGEPSRKRRAVEHDSSQLMFPFCVFRMLTIRECSAHNNGGFCRISALGVLVPHS